MNPVTVFIERFRAAVSVHIGPCCPALLESYSCKCAYCCIIGQIKWWRWNGESASMVWPTLGSRTAKEPNRTARSTERMTRRSPVLDDFRRLFLRTGLIAVADERFARPLADRRDPGGKLCHHRVSTRQVGAGLEKSNVVRRYRLWSVVFLAQQRARGGSRGHLSSVISINGNWNRNENYVWVGVIMQ